MSWTWEVQIQFARFKLNIAMRHLEHWDSDRIFFSEHNWLDLGWYSNEGHCRKEAAYMLLYDKRKTIGLCGFSYLGSKCGPIPVLWRGVGGVKLSATGRTQCELPIVVLVAAELIVFLESCCVCWCCHCCVALAVLYCCSVVGVSWSYYS